MRKILLHFFLISLTFVALMGCGGQLKTRFVPAGEYVPNQQAKVSHSVGSAGEVKIYFGPVAGFSLNEDELSVEKGFGHTVVGYIKVVYDKGMCDASEADKNTVVQKLQQAAFAHGANAVVYAHSNLGENPGFFDVCKYMNKREGYGHGWAVILSP